MVNLVVINVINDLIIRYYITGVQEFSTKKKKLQTHLKILGARKMTWTKFHTEDSEILGGSVQNLVVMATGRLGIVHSC